VTQKDSPDSFAAMAQDLQAKAARDSKRHHAKKGWLGRRLALQALAETPGPVVPMASEKAKIYRTSAIEFKTSSVFRWLLKTEWGWMPVENLSLTILRWAQRHAANPGFPCELRQFLRDEISLRTRPKSAHARFSEAGQGRRSRRDAQTRTSSE
jgi:hypothetical protein